MIQCPEPEIVRRERSPRWQVPNPGQNNVLINEMTKHLEANHFSIMVECETSVKSKHPECAEITLGSGKSQPSWESGKFPKWFNLLAFFSLLAIPLLENLTGSGIMGSKCNPAVIDTSNPSIFHFIRHGFLKIIAALGLCEEPSIISHHSPDQLWKKGQTKNAPSLHVAPS